MQRRKFLIGASSAAIGGSAILGSGAFSRVESQRDVTIEVARDPDAYLGLDGCPDSPNQSYTNINGDGHLEIQMSEANPTDAGGEGVNSDSRTWFDNVFQICNQGKEKACVWIEDDENWPTVGEQDSEQFAGERRVDFYIDNRPDLSLIGQENAFGLETGECLCVGVKTITKGLEEGDQLLADLDDEITITADVETECRQVVPEEEYAAFQVDLAWGDPLFTIDTDADPPLTYSTQERLLAWQHGDADPDTAPGIAEYEGQNGNRLNETGSTLGFARLFEKLVAIRFLDAQGGVVTETSGNLSVERGSGVAPPVEAEIEFKLVDDFDAQLEKLKDQLVEKADEGAITEEEKERGLAALNGGVDVTFTSYGGDEFGWNPPEFQILYDNHDKFVTGGTKTMTVDLPPL